MCMFCFVILVNITVSYLTSNRGRTGLRKPNSFRAHEVFICIRSTSEANQKI